MNLKLRRHFKRFLDCGAYCTPPGRAACAIDNARTLIEWEKAESAGLVRLVAEPERDSMADVFGDEIAKREAQSVERWGCWVVFSEVNAGSQSTGDQWQMCDSIGMCVYQNPLDPFQNCYVIDLMASALKRIPQPGNVDELCTSLDT